MRTNIEIDDKIMAELMRLSGPTTKRAIVDEALHMLASVKRQVGVRKLRGKVKWDGDLEQMRLGRYQEPWHDDNR